MPWLDLEQDILDELSDFRMDRRELRRDNSSGIRVYQRGNPFQQELRHAWLASKPRCVHCQQVIMSLSSINCKLPQHCSKRCQDAAYFLKQKVVIAALGLCAQRCGRHAEDGKSCCRECLNKKSVSQAARIAEMRRLGLCRDCKSPSSKLRCFDCAEKAKAANRKHPTPEAARCATTAAVVAYQMAKSSEERKAWSRSANNAFMRQTTPQQRSDMMRERITQAIQRKRVVR